MFVAINVMNAETQNLFMKIDFTKPCKLNCMAIGITIIILATKMNGIIKVVKIFVKLKFVEITIIIEK